MKVEYGGKVYDLDTAHIRFRQGVAIQDFTGVSVADWEDSLNFTKDEEGRLENPGRQWLKSLGAIYWLMLDQAGDKTPIDDIDFDYTEFYAAILKASLDELKALRAKAGEAEPDPTQPGTTPGLPSPESGTQTTTTPTRLVPMEVLATAST